MSATLITKCKAYTLTTVGGCEDQGRIKSSQAANVLPGASSLGFLDHFVSELSLSLPTSHSLHMCAMLYIHSCAQVCVCMCMFMQVCTRGIGCYSSGISTIFPPLSFPLPSSPLLFPPLPFSLLLPLLDSPLSVEPPPQLCVTISSCFSSLTLALKCPLYSSYTVLPPCYHFLPSS